VKSLKPDHVEQIPAMDGVIPGLPDPQDILTGELYRTLLEQIPAVTFMTSFEEGLQKIYVSPQIESVLGYTKDEWLAARPSGTSGSTRRTGTAGSRSSPTR
jgi:PAS domain-containing protein